MTRDGALLPDGYPEFLHDLRERVRDAVAKLAATSGDARALAGRLEPHVVAFAQTMSRAPLSIERQIRAES